MKLAAAITIIVLLATWLFYDPPMDTNVPVVARTGSGVHILQNIESVLERNPLKTHPLWDVCHNFSRQCTVALQQHDSSIALSDSDVTEVIAAHMRTTTPVTGFGLGDLPDNSTDIIELSRAAYLNELLTSGTISRETLGRGFDRNRAGLIRASSLLDKMIYAAAFGIDLAALEIAILNRLRNPPANLLQPLDADALDFTQAFEGEMYLAATLILPEARSYDKPHTFLDHLNRQYLVWSMWSRTPESDFWLSELPVEPTISQWRAPLSRLFEGVDIMPTSRMRYISELRLMNIRLLLVKVLATSEFLSDTADLSALESRLPAPAGWHWMQKSAAVCLALNTDAPAWTKQAVADAQCIDLPV